MLTSISPVAFANEEKKTTATDSIMFRSSHTNFDYGGGGTAVYRTKTVTMAPWALPDYYYQQEWIGGRLYKGYLYYAGSSPFGNVGRFPSHLVVGTYNGYLYAA